jgi:hypothetical protein
LVGFEARVLVMHMLVGDNVLIEMSLYRPSMEIFEHGVFINSGARNQSDPV